jgi:cobalt-zinc-cadmium efflux system protein
MKGMHVHEPHHGQEHGHEHDHGHAHSHDHAHPAMRPSVLAWAMVATLGLVVAEVFGGILGHSVALLNDAVHNLSDVPALGISWLAMRWAQRPADSERTYGYHRAGTLAAYTNAVLLVLLSLWLGYEAVQRLRAPVEVVESWMIWTSLAALFVNGGITLALVRGHADLNLRSILVHNFGDALSNIAIIAGALIMRYTHAHWIDPLLGLAIGLLILYSSFGILRESTHILLEGRPRETRIEEVACAILAVEFVQEVHDVHIWSLGGGHNAMSCHARIRICTWTNARRYSPRSRKKSRKSLGSNIPPCSSNARDCRPFQATLCRNPCAGVDACQPALKLLESNRQEGRRGDNPRCSLNCCVAARSRLAKGAVLRKPSRVT